MCFIIKLERMPCYLTSNYVCLIVVLFCALRVHVNRSLARKVNYQSSFVCNVVGRIGVFFGNYIQALFLHTNMLHP